MTLEKPLSPAETNDHRHDTWIPITLALADFDQVMTRYAVGALWDVAAARADLHALPRPEDGWVSYRRVVAILDQHVGRKAALESVQGMDAIKGRWKQRRVTMTRGTARSHPLPKA